jgi:hypothetical protein
MRLPTLPLTRTLALAVALALTGASSLAHAATITVGDPVSSCTPDCDYTTIAAAVSAAVDGDTLEIQPDTYDEGDITLDKNLTIRSASASLVTIDGADTDDHVFEIANGSTVTMRSLWLKAPGDSSNTATANLINRGTARLITVYVSGNGLETLYGGIHNTSEGLLILEGNGVVSGNASANYGGGINNFGALVAYNQTITGNHGAYGGGIRNHGGLVAVLKSSLSGNSTDNRGGAYSNESIYSGTVAVFPNSSLGGNSADIACDEEHSLYPSFVCTD